MTIDVAIFDYDYLIWQAACAGEKKTIEATHTPTNKMYPFKTRTEMYGHWKKKAGGWLAEFNGERAKDGLSPFLVEDFEIVDVQSAEPLENVLHTTKMMVEGPAKAVGAKRLEGFIGGKEIPLRRLERSTLLEYKGNRKEVLSPIYKGEVIDYLIKKYGAEVVDDGLEADDHVIIRSVENERKGISSVVIAVDKDAYGNPVKVYNPNKTERGIVDGDCFGEISWDEKNKEIRGHGRLYKYSQVISGDDTDNYKPQIFSEKEWGKKSAFDAIKNCKTDKEGWQVMWDVMNYLYPKQMKVKSWRGEIITLDAAYVLDEMFYMAHMARHRDDVVDTQQVLKNLNII